MMRFKANYIGLLLMTITLLAITSSLTVKSQDGGGDKPDFSDLAFRIDSPKNQYVRLEPIPLNLGLNNPTAKPVKAVTSFRLETGYVEMYVKSQGGEMQKVPNFSSARILFAPGTLIIEPQQNYEEDQLVALGLDRIFPQAGVYYIQLVIRDLETKKSIKSNQLMVNIEEPQGGDINAFNYLRDNVNPSNFFESVTKSGSDKAIEFVQLYGDSVYGDYATFMLGEYYWAYDEFEKASKHFEKVAKNANFIYGRKAKDYLSKIKEKQQTQN